MAYISASLSFCNQKDHNMPWHYTAGKEWRGSSVEKEPRSSTTVKGRQGFQNVPQQRFSVPPLHQKMKHLAAFCNFTIIVSLLSWMKNIKEQINQNQTCVIHVFNFIFIHMLLFLVTHNTFFYLMTGRRIIGRRA